MTTTKRCSRCRLEKPVAAFSISRSRKDGRNPWCRPCTSDYQRTRSGLYGGVRRTYYLTKRRAELLRCKYGLTPEAFAALLADQDGSCAICREVPVGNLCVDHDHSTGRVRGLLCRPCNSGLGHLKDDPERLRSALRYLERGDS